MLDLALLEDLPADALRRFGEHHIRLGRELIARAAFLEREAERARADRERMRAHRERLARIWEAVESYHVAGRTHDQAIAAAAAQFGMQAAAVDAVWRQMSRRNHKRAREVRDREIMRLYRRGHSDAEIGARFGLHPKTVNRRIREILADTETPRIGFLARWREAAE